MTELVAHYEGVRRVVMRLGKRIGSGAVGDIHRLQGRPGLVAKLYRTPADRAAYEQKIADMIGDPPDLPALAEDGREYPQIAWPVAALREASGAFVGFIMPEIDMTAATELENVLQRVSRRVRKLPEFYGGRVLLAANLAAVMAELHLHRHYFIDMKPINIRFYPGSWYLAILDTDGFSIQGTQRWSARQFSEEYIAPEARDEAPAALGLEQDLFALAVIIFRLLNNGLHPYQGLDARPGLPTTLQERIFAGLYAYGRRASADVRPAPATIHDSFEDTTRALFDRAFGGDPAARPTAEEWKVHLQGLITSGVLRRCSRRPDEHMHFSRACGLCALEARRAAAPPPPPPPPPPPAPRPPPLSPPLPTRSPLPPGAPSLASVLARIPRNAHLRLPQPNVGKWIAAAFAALLVFGVILIGVTDPTPRPSVATSAPRYSPVQAGQGAPEQQAAVARMGAETLCRSALSTDMNSLPLSEIAWETRPEYAAHVAEAQRRGYTIRGCVELLRTGLGPGLGPGPGPGPARQPESPPPDPAKSAYQLDQSPLTDVCIGALPATAGATSNPGQAKWEGSPFFESYVAEAIRRGQTPESCAMAVRLNLQSLPPSASLRTATSAAAGWRAFADDSAPPKRLRLQGLRFAPSGRSADGVSSIDTLPADRVAAVEVENATAGQTSVTFEIREGSRVAGACPPVVMTAASGQASCSFHKLSLAPGAYQLVAGSAGNDLASTLFLVTPR